MKKFDFLTRNQLSRYFNLGKKRNTNRILSSLSNYLSCARDGFESIYYLNNLGRQYVECVKIRKKNGQLQHVVMRNEFWLFYKCPTDWINEVKISDGTTSVIADGMFSRNGFKHFLEVDNLQTMKENREKIKRYRLLMENLAKQLCYYPTLVWLTTTKLRREQITKACEGLKIKVYTLDEIKGGI